MADFVAGDIVVVVAGVAVIGADVTVLLLHEQESVMDTDVVVKLYRCVHCCSPSRVVRARNISLAMVADKGYSLVISEMLVLALLTPP